MASMDEEIDELKMLAGDLKTKNEDIVKAQKFFEGRMQDFLKSRLNIPKDGMFGLPDVISKMRDIFK